MGAGFTVIVLGICLGIILAVIAMMPIGIVMLVKGYKENKKNEASHIKRARPIVIMLIGSAFMITSTFCMFHPANPIRWFFNHNHSGERRITQEEKAKNDTITVVEGLKNEDKEVIKELFCEKAKNTIDLDNELQKMFDVIDGNILSYDEPTGWGGGAKSRDGDYVEKHRGYCVSNIETDSGRIYEIRMEMYNINKDEPELLGITYLYIHETNNSVTVAPKAHSIEVKIDK